MFLKRQTQGSVVCPTCGRLVGVQDEKCFGCGRARPGLWGFGPAVQGLTRDLSFATIVTFGCIGMYVVAILLNPQALAQSSGIFSLFSPGGLETFLLGSSGAAPIFGYGRWWTVFSATWLHGGLLHIGFNLYWLRRMSDEVGTLFGTGRLAIIYVLAGAVGFLGTAVMALFPLPGFLQGAGNTVGASASLCGLLGATWAYGQAHKDWLIQQNVKSFAISILIFGLLMPGIDNWAHIFGFLGGYLVAKALKPLEGEGAIHPIIGGVLLVISLLAIIASVIHGLPIYNAAKQG